MSETLLNDQVRPVIVNGKKYLSVKDFALITNRSYTSIYMMSKYGFHDGSEPLKSINWNNRVLILLSEKNRVNQIKAVGRPRKGED